MTITKQHLQIFLKTTLSFLIIILLYYSFFRRLDNDEMEAIRTAWKISQGEQIYTGFFQHHHPFLNYSIAPIINLFGASTNTILILRFLTFLMFLGIGLATYLISKTVTNKTIGLISTLFLYATPVFTIKAIEIRPDTPMTLFIIFAFLFLLLYYKAKKYWYIILSALCLSTSFLFLQKAGVFISFLGIILIVDFFRHKLTFKDILIYGFTFSIPILMYLGYLLKTDSFSSYITFCWIFNQKILPNNSNIFSNYLSSTVTFIKQFPETISNILILLTNSKVAQNSNQSFPLFFFAFITNIPVWIMYITGLIFSTKTSLLKCISFLSLGLVFTASLSPLPFQQYLMPAMPFAAIIASHAFYTFFNPKKLLFIIFILITIIPPISINYIRRAVFSPITKQFEKINYVLSITNSDDYVLDNGMSFDTFNLFRKDLDFFWLGTLYTVLANNKLYTYDMYKLIKKYKPKVINMLSITKTPREYFNPEKLYLIKKCYKKSEKHDDILIRIK